MRLLLLKLGRFEAWSLILLVGVAMPIRSITKITEIVSVMGWIHGALWIAYVLLIIIAWYKGIISTKFSFVLGFLSVIPAGPFFVEHKLKNPQGGEDSPPDKNLEPSMASVDS